MAAAWSGRRPRPWQVGWPRWEASEAVCQLPVLDPGCHPSALAPTWGSRRDAPATRCGLSPVAGASLLRASGSHSRPTNSLQSPRPMWETSEAVCQLPLAHFVCHPGRAKSPAIQDPCRARASRWRRSSYGFRSCQQRKMIRSHLKARLLTAALCSFPLCSCLW